MKRNYASSDGGSGDFGLVDGYNGGREAYGQSRDDTADDEHPTVDGSALKDRTDNPEDSGDDDGGFATDAVGELGYG